MFVTAMFDSSSSGRNPPVNHLLFYATINYGQTILSHKGNVMGTKTVDPAGLAPTHTPVPALWLIGPISKLVQVAGHYPLRGGN